MKITLSAIKPRNPLAHLARFRCAGSHRAAGGSVRQQASRAMQRELDRLKQSP
jgi:hypothetical protein